MRHIRFFFDDGTDPFYCDEKFILADQRTLDSYGDPMEVMAAVDNWMNLYPQGKVEFLNLD